MKIYPPIRRVVEARRCGKMFLMLGFALFLVLRVFHPPIFENKVLAAENLCQPISLPVPGIPGFPAFDRPDEVTLEPTNWPTDFPLYPATTIPCQPVKACLKGGRCAIYLMQEGVPSAQEVKVWYQQNAPKYGWVDITEIIISEVIRQMTLQQVPLEPTFIKNISDQIGQAVFIKKNGSQCSIVAHLSSAKGKSVLMHTDNIDQKTCALYLETAISSPSPSRFPLSPTTTPPAFTPPAAPETKEICSSTDPRISSEEWQKIMQLKAEIKIKYGFSIVDSNLCGKIKSCNDNSIWRADQLKEIKETLDLLPSCFLDNLNLNKDWAIAGQMTGRSGIEGIVDKAIEGICCRQPSLSPGAFGQYLNFGYNNITVCGNNYQLRKGSGEEFKKISLGGKVLLKEVIIHEFTHALQYPKFLPPEASLAARFFGLNTAYTNPLVIDWLKETGWSPTGTCLPFVGCFGASLSSPSDVAFDGYLAAKTDPLEDMAESVRLFVVEPQTLKNISPRRYNFVRDKIMCGKTF